MPAAMPLFGGRRIRIGRRTIAKYLEAPPFDGSVVLLDDVVQVLHPSVRASAKLQHYLAR